MNQAATSPTVLVAPLDWGLGHATRCVPVINALLLQGCKVILAASGKAKALLQQEFPALPLLHLPGYEVEYAASSWGLAAKIVAQIPKVLKAIEKENLWLQKAVAEQQIDAVISDNRYGLHHPAIKSILITHQLRIKTPLKPAEDLLQKAAYRYINRFDECWVPDAEGEPNLAGALSHPLKKPAVPVYYTGPLSRFAAKPAGIAGDYLLLLLSGPEPQRTLLEEHLLQELKSYSRPVVLVRGLPQAAHKISVGKNVTVYAHLPAAELEAITRGAWMVISRSGYSTVMDLAALQKKSILVPTPGQTEQAYLAQHLMNQNFALCMAQKNFGLKSALQMAEEFLYKPYAPATENGLQKVVERFVLSLPAQPITGV